MIAPLSAGVAQADEKFKGLQAYSFFVKDVILPQPGAAVVEASDRIIATCDWIFSFPAYSAHPLRKEFASLRLLWQHF